MASLLDYLNANAGANSVPAPAASPGAAPSPLQALIAQVNAPANNVSPAQAAQYAGPSDDTTPVPTVDPNAAPTTVGGIDVQAAKPAMNYDNTQAQASSNNALNKEAAAQTQEDQQPGARNGPTSYGILPQSMQHGTLSKVLGLLGDAYLVHHGRAPAYLQGQQAVAEGNAMAGMTTNPGAAAERVAGLGIPATVGMPGSADLADKIYQQSNQAKIAQGQLELNNFYRENQVTNQREGRFQQAVPQVAGLMQGVAPANWAGKVATIDKMLASRYGVDKQGIPYKTHSDVGIPDTYDANYAAHAGETGGQIARDANAAGSQATTRRGQDLGLQGREVIAGAMGNRPGPNPNSTTMLQGLIAAKKAGQPLTQDENNFITRMTTPPKNASTGHLAITGGAQAQQQFSVGKQYHDKNGNVATYRGMQNGKPVFN